MTTVSRFSLASELLCFSRFDEGEYILLKLASHGIERAAIVSPNDSRTIDRVGRALVNSRCHGARVPR